MITLNWNKFRSKFYLRERAAFESLAYMLFCYEHRIKVGIFRFKNQTGIETEQILHQEKLTGFKPGITKQNYRMKNQSFVQL